MRDRSLLKDNAPLFEWLMRLIDPVIVVVVMQKLFVRGLVETEK